MGFLIALLVLVLASGLVWYLRARWTRIIGGMEAAKAFGSDLADAKTVHTVLLITQAALGLALVIAFVGRSYRQVPAGHVDVVYTLGTITGQIGEGPNFIVPWATTQRASIQITSHPFPGMACFSKETQAVTVSATVNLAVSPVAIQNLYRKVGPNWFDVIVAPRVLQNFKDETVKYEAVEIAPNRERIRHDAATRLALDLEAYSVTVADVLLDNIEYGHDFTKAIEDKQVQTQKALEEEQRVKVVFQQALQKMAEARGDSAAIAIRKAGEAEGNRRLSASLTTQVVQWQAIEKLNPQVEVIYTPPGGSGLLLNVGGAK